MTARVWMMGVVVLTFLDLALVGLSGCSSGPSPSATPPQNSVIFSKEIQPIFTDNCVVCHQGAGGPARLNLEPNLAYQNLVNVPSSQSPLMRVAPGAPDKSYLLNKLRGTQSQVGGSGAQMPFNAPPLEQTKIDLVAKWISQGAQNN